MATKGSTDVLGPNDMGGSKRPRVSDDSLVLDEDWTAKKSKKDKKDKKQDKKEVSKKVGKKGKGKKSVEEDDENDQEVVLGDDEDDVELTLGQKLEQLSKSINDLEDARDKDVQQVEKQIQRRIPTADSLVTLLEQALQSNDAALLEQCLMCTNLDIIDATTLRLPTSRVLTLLKTLVSKFEKRPSRGLLVTHWLSFILKHHISFLITVPDLSRQLAGLSQLLEQRLSTYSKLASLSGRLELLMSQVSSQKTIGDSGSMEPLAEYQDE
jgi:U3 small nucleolar RNA-associated protein 5